MGRYKLETIPYDNLIRKTEDLLAEGFSAAARGKYEHAEEIALVILMEANSAGDDKLFAKGKELANACHVPSRFHPDYSQPQATSDNNRPDPDEPPIPDPPNDILRLFGTTQNYKAYIKECRGQAPKTMAWLYKNKFGVIQLDREKGIVALLFGHLTKLKLLNCSQSNFTQHYRKV